MEATEIRTLTETKSLLERWFHDHDDNHPGIKEQRDYYRSVCDQLRDANVPEAIVRKPFYSNYKVVCANCNGEREINGQVCRTCGGTGALNRVITGQMELFRTI